SAKAPDKAPVPVEAKEKGPVLGADLQPVPVPSVRDLSIPTQRGKGGKVKALEPVLAEPELQGEVISAKEIVAAVSPVAAATTAQVLGKEPPVKVAVAEMAAVAEGVKPEGSAVAIEAADSAAPADSVSINDNSGLRARKPIRRKPITVASAPTIGNYQLPSMDFLQFPDQTIR